MSGEVTRRKGGKGKGKSSANQSSKTKVVEDEGSPIKTKIDEDGSPSKKKGIPSETSEEDPPVKLKYGPMPRFSKQRLWSRGILILGLLVIVWFNSGKKNEEPFAAFDEDLTAKAMKTRCSADHEAAVKPFPKCRPKQCGRFVVDHLFSPHEIYTIKDLMQRVFQKAKVEGTASVFDFQLGRLQFEGDSSDLYKLNMTQPIFQNGDQLIYQNVKGKLQRMISSYFAVDHWSLHLASPFFMTSLTRKFAKKEKDEYWHPAVHQKQFKNYQYSAVLFMSDYGKDIDGGRLIFIDGDATNRTVEPKVGRAIAFTSGEESLHYTERVLEGTRLALTIGFTCNPEHGVSDPKL